MFEVDAIFEAQLPGSLACDPNLFDREIDSRYFDIGALCDMERQSTPTATQFGNLHAVFDFQLGTDMTFLVELSFLERVIGAAIISTCVLHVLIQEQAIEIV